MNDNFKDEEISKLYLAIRMELGDFFNSPKGNPDVVKYFMRKMLKYVQFLNKL